MFSVACFTQASSLLIAFISAVTMQDSWLVVLIGAVLCLPLIWLYRTLMVTFPGQNLLQVFDEVYGPVAGKSSGYHTYGFLSRWLR
jgi:spore germination protein KB